MITKKDVEMAREKIKNIIKMTPVLSSSHLSTACNNNIFLKGEHLQKTGAFKVRGATNKILQAINDGAKFVTAASSGNHGQAVAYIASKFGIPSLIVVPEDATISKVKAIKAYGGMVETYGVMSSERSERAIETAKAKKGIYISPYDDPLVMAGQGTLGLEIMEQVENIDIIVVPIGGGGLTSGILTVVKETNPNIKVIGVEPETSNSTYRSLQKGEITAIPPTNTIADGLKTTQPGKLTFPIIQKYLDELVLVSEKEIRYAFTFVLERMKQVIEPSSAATIAAAMFGKLGVERKNIVTVITGGNIDVKQLSSLVI